MRPPDKRNAAPVVRDGEDFRHDAFSEGIVPTLYFTTVASATEFAANVIGRRHRLSPPIARLVCHLAGLGGAA